MRIATLALIACLISGCATSNEISLSLRVKELEAHLAGQQDDNAMLMLHIAKQEGYIRELEAGAMWQAEQIAKFRDGNCQI